MSHTFWTRHGTDDFLEVDLQVDEPDGCVVRTCPRTIEAKRSGISKGRRSYSVWEHLQETVNFLIGENYLLTGAL